MTVLERGWLSANSVVFTSGPAGAAVVDTGYCSHAAQTLALLAQALNGQKLARILNTHLHSDHCGGNATLQQHWPQVETAIPPGLAAAVAAWDAQALSYTPTGQDCPRFTYQTLLQPGSQVWLGQRLWQIHAAPGHDHHAILLFEPAQGILISGDALWQNGLGVVFPELDGEAAFAEVAATLDLIAHLAPRTVVPGHGAVFQDVQPALDNARRRLDRWAQNPMQHARHAAKVLLKYKLLEWQQIALPALQHWLESTPYFSQLHRTYFSEQPLQYWHQSLADELVHSGAARWQGGYLHNF